MPWLGIPYEDEGRRQDLTMTLNIKAIPTLVILDAEDNIITSEGRLEVNEDLEGMVNNFLFQLTNMERSRIREMDRTLNLL